MQKELMELTHLLELAKMIDASSPVFDEIMEEILTLLEKQKLTAEGRAKLEVFRQHLTKRSQK